MDKLTEMELKELEGMEDERFRVVDTDTAIWTFRKIRALKEEINKTNKIADAEIERIEEWREKENEKAQNSIEFFEGLLTEYFVRERAKDPEFKINTPYGRVSTRKQQPKWNYNDKKLVEFFKENRPDFVRVKETPNKSEFKKAVKEGKGFKILDSGEVVDTETGEVIEGVTIEERPEKINIKVVE